MPHLEFGDLALLLTQIGCILLASRLVGVVTSRIEQPFVIAEMVAGIALGPSLLGAMFPGAMGTLFPIGSLSTLKMVSQLGLILFMFIVGLELDPAVLKSRPKASVLISHASVALPFALGSVAALWLWPAYASHRAQFSSFVLFLGVSMSVTAFPVLARILSERRLLGTRVGAIAIACAAVDDVTAWFLLATAVCVARAQSAIGGLWTLGLTSAFIALMFLGLKPLMQRIALRPNARALTPSVSTAILLILLLCSSVTEVIGVHALFGAFLFGTIIPRTDGVASVLAKRLETVTVLLFLPLFFAYSGLRTEFRLVESWKDFGLVALLTAIATVGKFGGSALAARLSGFKWREAGAIGILMNTRGLMELIVLNVGLDLEIISPALFTMLVIVALVTTFATSPILQWVYPTHEMMKERAPTDQNDDARQELAHPGDRVAAPEVL